MADVKARTKGRKVTLRDAQRLALIKAKPERATWWIAMESLALSDKPAGARFCKGNEPSYAQMLQYSADQDDMFDSNEEALACFCGD